MLHSYWYSSAQKMIKQQFSVRSFEISYFMVLSIAPARRTVMMADPSITSLSPHLNRFQPGTETTVWMYSSSSRRRRRAHLALTSRRSQRSRFINLKRENNFCSPITTSARSPQSVMIVTKQAVGVQATGSKIIRRRLVKIRALPSWDEPRPGWVTACRLGDKRRALIKVGAKFSMRRDWPAWVLDLQRSENGTWSRQIYHQAAWWCRHLQRSISPLLRCRGIWGCYRESINGDFLFIITHIIFTLI